VGFVVDQVAMGQVFSEYFGFPCQFSFHRLSMYGYNLYFALMIIFCTVLIFLRDWRRLDESTRWEQFAVEDDID
jgi:hypothetical protein